MGWDVQTKKRANSHGAIPILFFEAEAGHRFPFTFDQYLQNRPVYFAGF
jgi:hypothetical protein